MDNTERIKNTQLFVLDMDGTIYLGDRVLPGALEFVAAARESGRINAVKVRILQPETHLLFRDRL